MTQKDATRAAAKDAREIIENMTSMIQTWMGQPANLWQPVRLRQSFEMWFRMLNQLSDRISDLEAWRVAQDQPYDTGEIDLLVPKKRKT